MGIRDGRNGRKDADLDFAGFAQEFLRRNPDYVLDYDAVMRADDRDVSTSAQEVMARRWGLCFPLPA